MSDGYYKYRCKNFYSHNCTNWVWMNNTVCAACIAAGREDQYHLDHEHNHLNNVELLVNPTVTDSHLLLHTENSSVTDGHTQMERTRNGMIVDITASSKGLGDLFEPESYHS